ncbi:HAD domain-containing protein [Bacteroides reticulotermitis]|uniref:Uncharacterized protein n=1 Tax=Bacteroides reticulotermitis TaxID=1133319 RepID=A0A840CUV2_9BACE|nr:HAD domain-containing protein [Bacteroides reticulotermitis]MBB4043837.1 hypothetical protein [Bacteroides reticulotermitis]
MKVIFLDFDGVITTLKSKWHIDLEKCAIVKDICDATGAKIVISSSWRRYSLEQTIKAITDEERAFSNPPFPIPEYVIDVTSRMYGFKHGEKEKHCRLQRGNEIERWLSEHSDVTHYVILNDKSDMLLCQKENFIQTDACAGINESDKGKAIEILNKK